MQQLIFPLILYFLSECTDIWKYAFKSASLLYTHKILRYFFGNDYNIATQSYNTERNLLEDLVNLKNPSLGDVVIERRP